MMKIVSGIIVAVCAFQAVRAGLLDKLPGKSLLDSALQDEVSSAVDSLSDFGNKLRNNFEESQIQLKTSSECTKLYEDGEEVVNELITTFSSCIENNTQLIGKQIGNMNELINKLNKTLLDMFEETMNCVQNPLSNWIGTMECIGRLSSRIANINSLLQSAWPEISELMGILPIISQCYQKAYFEAGYPNVGKLMTEAKQCFTTVINPFHL